jgi:hypothetical protein
MASTSPSQSANSPVRPPSHLQAHDPTTKPYVIGSNAAPPIVPASPSASRPSTSQAGSSQFQPNGVRHHSPNLAQGSNHTAGMQNLQGPDLPARNSPSLGVKRKAPGDTPASGEQEKDGGRLPNGAGGSDMRPPPNKRTQQSPRMPPKSPGRGRGGSLHARGAG